MEIRNEIELTKLRKLKKLSFGVYRFDENNFLDQLPLENLSSVSLVENAKANFDLKPLQKCAQLIDLYISGHRKNIEVLGSLPALKSLRLNSIRKEQRLSFLCKIGALRSLTLLLGGRTDIEEVQHASLEELAILRVRGFENLGSLSRFPGLRRLQIDDQLQLHSILIDAPRLEDLVVYNCKNCHDPRPRTTICP